MYSNSSPENGAKGEWREGSNIYNQTEGEYFLSCLFFFNGILLHNVVLISSVQQCELAMHVNMPLPFWTSLPPPIPPLWSLQRIRGIFLDCTLFFLLYRVGQKVHSGFSINHYRKPQQTFWSPNIFLLITSVLFIKV